MVVLIFDFFSPLLFFAELIKKGVLKEPNATKQLLGLTTIAIIDIFCSDIHESMNKNKIKNFLPAV